MQKRNLLVNKIMPNQITAEKFLSQYEEAVNSHALILREVIFKHLPDIIEQTDVKAGMIAYCYGQKYSQLICTIIPSKKGLKLGFNRGVELQDPSHILQGKGKISRYVEIVSEEQVHSNDLKKLILNGLDLYKHNLKERK